MRGVPFERRRRQSSNAFRATSEILSLALTIEVLRADSPAVNWFWRMYAVCSSGPGLLTLAPKEHLFHPRIGLFACRTGQPLEAVEVHASPGPAGPGPDIGSNSGSPADFRNYDDIRI